MSVTTLSRAVAFTVILSTTAALPASALTPVHLVVVDVKVVALGYRISQLIGREVQNDKGETLGRIDDMIIGQDRVLFAILSVGGFLGIGDRKVVAPYASLRLTSSNIVWPGATKAAVNKLPPFQYQ